MKVKRRFFWLAQRHHYTWFARLNSDNYELGSGKRVIAKHGVLGSQYLITVPSHMKNEQR
ncbi:type IV toxin-antitoxin system AbiEi family antitoxin domain-containing protein [Endozoicomonas ascidiicola]|uniref:type IV toxin-antitoxin system AbiEi family antitoxin domain-containing protein n=1 Tax=Endozoicomonas ascidiicola TaxID=1698521 RepID=UPI000BA4267A